MKLGVNVGYWGMGIGREDQLAAFRDAGAGTLAMIPMAFDREDRIAQLRAVAQRAG